MVQTGHTITNLVVDFDVTMDGLHIPLSRATSMFWGHSSLPRTFYAKHKARVLIKVTPDPAWLQHAQTEPLEIRQRPNRHVEEGIASSHGR
jgi:hypothetical protein